MDYQFLKPNHPILTKIAKKTPKAQLNSPQIKEIAKVMLKIIRGEQKGRKRGVGLAAPQIGILKRIILVDVKADSKGKVGDLRVYINPEIIWKSKRSNEWYEGCYSTGNICGIVSRPTSIKIKAFIIAPGAYPNRVTKLHYVEENEFPLYRDQENWKNWPKKYPLPLA